MQWYYSNNNQQLGPVEDAELQSLAAQGVIHAQTLVWREGMADWQPYSVVFGAAAGGQSASGTVNCPNCGAVTDAHTLIPLSDKVVCPQCSGGYSQRLIEGAGVASLGKPEGTGGQMPNVDIRAHARDVLSAQWGAAALFTFLLQIIQFGINMAANFIPFVGAFVPYFLTGSFTLGYMQNMQTISRGGESSNDCLFSGFQDYGRSLGVYMLPLLLVAVPVFVVVGIVAAMSIVPLSMSGEEPSEETIMMLVIGGTILGLIVIVFATYISLKFSLSYFILLDNPGMGVIDTLKLSSSMMKGHMMKLLSLYLSFIGWAILCVFTIFIGFLWLGPYVAVSFARFYDDL